MGNTIDLSTDLETKGFTFKGNDGSDQSGISVSSAGDVNGDGYDDLIIGAYGTNFYKGTAYVIYGENNNPGSIDLSTIEDKGFTIVGAQSYDYTGCSVSSAGDVNGDGYDDIIVGAYGADPTTPVFLNNAGISYVIYGSANNPGNINLFSALGSKGYAILGSAESATSGASVSSAGDMNGDGYDDIIIGEKNSYGQGGISYVIFGSANNSETINLSLSLGTKGFAITGSNAGDLSGSSVSSAGDFNNDGYSDIIIGAHNASPGAKAYAGISYVIFGSATNPGTINLAVGLGNKGFAIIGGAANDHSGRSVASAGDVNGDGFSDIIIGANYASPSTRTYAGISYVIYGNRTNPGTIYLANSLETSGFAILGATEVGSSGWSVSSAGDINNDGFMDVIIGAPGEKSNAGISYVLYGEADNPGTIDLLFLGTKGFAVMGDADGDGSGYSVSSAGDVNGDSYDDIIIGAYLADSYSKTNAGASYLIYGTGDTVAPTIAPTLVPSITPSYEPTQLANTPSQISDNSYPQISNGVKLNSGSNKPFNLLYSEAKHPGNYIKGDSTKKTSEKETNKTSTQSNKFASKDDKLSFYKAKNPKRNEKNSFENKLDDISVKKYDLKLGNAKSKYKTSSISQEIQANGDYNQIHKSTNKT